MASATTLLLNVEQKIKYTRNNDKTKKYNTNSYNKNNNNDNNNNLLKNFIINSLPQKPKVLAIPICINSLNYLAILDTGSNYNYISRKIITRHQIKTAKIPQIEAELVNGAKVISDETTGFTCVLFKKHELELTA